MHEERSLREWIRRFNAEEFSSRDRDTQCNAGWYDWFCGDKGLRGRLYKMAPAVKRIAKSKLVNQDTSYVFFKNNCPMRGPLYDDFRICSMETGDVIWTVTPKSGHTGCAELYGSVNNFTEPVVGPVLGPAVDYRGRISPRPVLVKSTIYNIYAYFGV